MLVLEYKVKAKPNQYQAIDEAIRTVQFIRNKCIRLWMDEPKTNKYDLSKQSAVLARTFPFADSDHNAGINILNSGLGTTGHVGTFALDAINAWGDLSSTVVGENLQQQDVSLSQESPSMRERGVSSYRS